MELNMMVNGKKTNSMVWEKKHGQMELVTKDNILKVRKMEKENSNGQMDPLMMDSS